MKWRIAERKMQFVRKTIWTKPVTNIARKANVDAPNVEITITFLLSYMSDIFPTGN